MCYFVFVFSDDFNSSKKKSLITNHSWKFPVVDFLHYTFVVVYVLTILFNWLLQFKQPSQTPTQNISSIYKSSFTHFVFFATCVETCDFSVLFHCASLQNLILFVLCLIRCVYDSVVAHRIQCIHNVVFYIFAHLPHNKMQNRNTIMLSRYVYVKFLFGKLFEWVVLSNTIISSKQINPDNGTDLSNNQLSNFRIILPLSHSNDRNFHISEIIYISPQFRLSCVIALIDIYVFHFISKLLWGNLIEVILNNSILWDGGLTNGHQRWFLHF